MMRHEQLDRAIVRAFGGRCYEHYWTTEIASKTRGLSKAYLGVNVESDFLVLFPEWIRIVATRLSYLRKQGVVGVDRNGALAATENEFGQPMAYKLGSLWWLIERPSK